LVLIQQAETLEINKISKKHLDVFKVISEAAEQIGQEVYVIGGYVRDYYMNRIQDQVEFDIDFVTVGSGIKLARKVAENLGASHISVFKQFGTAQVKTNGLILEFVGARKESYRRDSRKPVVENGTLRDDQIRRDFTINALSWSLNKDDFGSLRDPFNGMRDLEKKLIRTPVDPEITFDDDPLRMLRAIRFATQLNFKIEDNTYEGIRKMAKRISIVSKERIIDETNKIVSAPRPSIGFALLFKTGILKLIFPEMHKLHGVDEIDGISHKDNFWHTLKVLDNTAKKSDDLWLRWAAIMHDIAKPPTKRFQSEAGWTFHGHDALGAKWTPKIFRRLGLPLDERMRFVKKMVRLHLRPIALVSDKVTDSAIRRLLFEAGDDIDNLMILCRADITSKNDRKVRQYLNNFDKVEKKMEEVEKKDRLRNWQPPVNGKEIMEALNIKPGPVVGKIKKDIEEAILNGDIPNEHDAAFEYMMKIKDKYV
jgi:poly(A) polymerase